MDWDLAGWVQYFASRGYAVIEPQFRGSTGWGQKLWRAGDREWGQKMQDDLDDAVKWLIAQHVADPKRVAIFGYSYGGYAALAASIRPNGLYQCAISGAGAGDLRARSTRRPSTTASSASSSTRRSTASTRWRTPLRRRSRCCSTMATTT